jgi:two-component system cell cycle sensor histidine kinase/response regulator CckA
MPSSSIINLEKTGQETQVELRGLILKQKTELIGDLAQAMANQFNNTMMAVTSHIELELKKAGRKDRHGLEQVLSHATRATSLIQKLLSFSRKHTSAPEPLQFDAVIGELNVLLRELLGEQVDLTLQLGANCEIVADRVEIEQTLLALVLVARKAVNGLGTLRISTTQADLNQEFIGSYEEAAPGKYVLLAVENDGRANVDQTQQVSMSLAAVRGIVKSSGGLVRFSRSPGTGSSFKLYFPASTSATVAENVSTWPRNPAIARTILVVEDDDAVRVPAVEFLMMEGFKVLQARTGGEAFNVVQRSRSSLDVLVTDIFMPKMSGREVAASLLKTHADLKVLYISGDPGSDASGEANIAPNKILRKPFRLNILRDKIHDLLGE